MDTGLSSQVIYLRSMKQYETILFLPSPETSHISQWGRNSNKVFLFHKIHYTAVILFFLIFLLFYYDQEIKRIPVSSIILYSQLH